PLSLAGAVDCLTRESAPAVYTDLWELATACDAEPYGRTLDPEALWRRWEGEPGSKTRLRSERVQEPGNAEGAAPDPALEDTWEQPLPVPRGEAALKP
ncbi:MAG TPA: hypothetical protein VF017_03185, partial [Thermoanaerobaculia bacterium]|nr:hypothetical protein [Thermoanaerobaculia bacterium]